MVSLQAAIVAIALASPGQTVLLDFYTDWCKPCKAMQPTVQALINAGHPVEQVNADQNKALANQFHVNTYPCFVMVVDGREVDRVVGGTTYYKLEQMCKMATAPPRASPVMLAQNVPPTAARPAPVPPASSSPFDGWDNQPIANQPVPAVFNAPSAGGVSDAALLAASVRLRVEDPGGHSCGSGTIIDARNGKALILTCGHIFRDWQRKGPIEVDLFGPNGQQRVAGVLRSFDLTRDVGLVVIDAPFPITTARVAPPGYRIDRGVPVASVGCNNGDWPTARHSQVTSLDKFVGPPNLQVAGQPVEGRSGGGLFSSDGYVIGVCSARDPSDEEGLFAALGSIYAELDRKDTAGRDLSFVYNAPGASPADASVSAAPAAIAAAAPPDAPRSMPSPLALASAEAAPVPAADAASRLPPHEQAAWDEVRRREKAGDEVVFIVRSRDNPEGKSEVFVLDHASPEFVRQLSTEGRRQDKVYPTSLAQPKPRKILLEWSAEGNKGEGGRGKAEAGNGQR